ncbi:Lipopolysaccharide export system protein LptA [Pontivivens insulae]|uniref:Lipopolysaccharide export system protein LptA n=2 Tax=Pontivivens insulae TaxID=1639689 RepID=A0A2R8A821_9RHOB|nr:lipopolysaccharide export system protein LptA [Pontivivens insulae]SPF28384.1 Lipopolysaccharide export system protein LptA [Pontivivens insulae]
MMSRAILISALVALASPVGAQQAQPFSTFQHDPTQPLEVFSDTLGVSQAANTAVFRGSVEAVQGELTLTADEMTVTYDEATGDVVRLVATGDVFLKSLLETAEGQFADYMVAEGTLNMSGDAMLTQGNNALSSDEMRIDLNTGSGEFIGRVRTIFVPTSQ